MKLLLPLLFILLCISGLQAQEKKAASVSYTIKEIDHDFSVDKVFHKKTGKKITEKEFKELVKTYPNLYLEQIIGKNGEILRYLYNPDEQSTAVKLRKPQKTVSVGEAFPPFEVQTINGTIIDSETLRGKLILLRFELHSNDFRFKKHEITELDEKINELTQKDLVKAILIFRGGKKEVIEGFTLKGSNFELVANGGNFMKKYGITRYPLTLLINQEGNLIDYYNYSEDIIIKDYIKN